MKDVSTDQFKRVIESQHGGKASFVQSVKVQETQGNQRVWDGVVHVFDLKSHPEAKRAYAWSAPIEGSAKSRFFAVLHQGRVTGPLEAVKAAIGAIRKWGGPGTKK
jgi:hypothetical protein